jgi:hypothetical protein
MSRPENRAKRVDAEIKYGLKSQLQAPRLETVLAHKQEAAKSQLGN